MANDGMTVHGDNDDETPHCVNGPALPPDWWEIAARLTCDVPAVLRKEPLRSRDVLELARTMSKRDW